MNTFSNNKGQTCISVNMTFSWSSTKLFKSDSHHCVLAEFRISIWSTSITVPVSSLTNKKMPAFSIHNVSQWTIQCQIWVDENERKKHVRRISCWLKDWNGRPVCSFGWTRDETSLASMDLLVFQGTSKCTYYGFLFTTCVDRAEWYITLRKRVAINSVIKWRKKLNFGGRIPIYIDIHYFST